MVLVAFTWMLICCSADVSNLPAPSQKTLYSGYVLSTEGTLKIECCLLDTNEKVDHYFWMYGTAKVRWCILNCLVLSGVRLYFPGPYDCQLLLGVQKVTNILATQLLCNVPTFYQWGCIREIRTFQKRVVVPAETVKFCLQYVQNVYLWSEEHGNEGERYALKPDIFLFHCSQPPIFI